MPTVSVILPTYNRARLLPRALQSVLWQTFPDLEVLVVDDASHDDTAEVVGRIADPRVRYLRHDSNRGLGAARNTGIRHAHGAYIAFLDDDDIWLPEKLEKQVQCFKTSDKELGAVHCGFLTWWQTAPPNPPFVPTEPWSMTGDILIKLLKGDGYVVPVTMILPAEVVKEVGGFDETFVREEDTDFNIRIATRYLFGFVADTLVIVYETPGSLMKDHYLVFEMRRRLLEKHKSLYAGYPKFLAQRLAAEAHGCLGRGHVDQAVALVGEALLADPDNILARRISLRLRHPLLWRMGSRAKLLARTLVSPALSLRARPDRSDGGARSGG